MADVANLHDATLTPRTARPLQDAEGPLPAILRRAPDALPCTARTGCRDRRPASFHRAREDCAECNEPRKLERLRTRATILDPRHRHRNHGHRSCGRRHHRDRQCRHGARWWDHEPHGYAGAPGQAAASATPRLRPAIPTTLTGSSRSPSWRKPSSTRQVLAQHEHAAPANGRPIALFLRDNCRLARLGIG